MKSKYMKVITNIIYRTFVAVTLAIGALTASSPSVVAQTPRPTRTPRPAPTPVPRSSLSKVAEGYHSPLCSCVSITLPASS